MSLAFRRLNTHAEAGSASAERGRLNTHTGTPSSLTQFQQPGSKDALTRAAGLFRRLNTGVDTALVSQGIVHPVNSDSRMKTAAAVFRRLNTDRDTSLLSLDTNHLFSSHLLTRTAELFRRLNTGAGRPLVSLGFFRSDNKNCLVVMSALFRRLNTNAQSAFCTPLFRRLTPVPCQLGHQSAPMSHSVHPYTYTWQERCLWRIYTNGCMTITHPTEPRLERGSVFLGFKKGKP